MMRKFIYTAVASFAFASVACAQTPMPEPLDLGPAEPLSVVGQSETHEFSVEIADDAQEQSRGLMFREFLAPDKGMLFEFDEPRISSIWMKNTAISLDILFVRKNGQILKIVHDATPYSLQSHTSEAPVSAVLELPGGRSKALGIIPGDTIIHPFFENTEMKTDSANE